MNDPPKKTDDFTVLLGFDALCSQFESDWQAALQGAPPPCVDNYLEQVAERDRAGLHVELKAMECLFLKRLEQSRTPASNVTLDVAPSEEQSEDIADINEQTIADGDVAARKPPPDTEHNLAHQTIDLSVDKPAPEPEPVPSQTIAFSPDAPIKASGQTLDFLPANSQLGATIDAAPGRDDDETAHSGRPGPTVPGYTILGELGRGAMGVVYKAQQKGLNRLVALKMMLAGGHAGAEQLARFHTEARAVARLQNPNIVQIYDVGEHDGLPYFSLEFVDGGTLHDRLGGKTQPPRDAARMIETLARAMDCAHQLGIIHRDLKPANVLMTAQGILKISDFGLAKRLEGEDSGQTRSGTLMGTPSYMSPEQARGDTHDIGPAADQYALGAMLYEMLTGRPPFQGASILDTLEQVRTHEPVPPSRLQPSVPRDLETICLRTLQKEPRQRYATTGELAEDLRRFHAGEPILARPVGRIERTWRWCKRNPKLASLYSAIGLLLATVGVFLSVMAVRAAEERETITEAGKLSEQRLAEATKAIKAGRYIQAQNLLRPSDPLIETNPALAERRTELHRLRDQVNLYAEFKELSDRARYYSLVSHKDARAHCQKLLALYDQIEQKTGRAECDLPPLDAARERLLREEFFEAFLISAQVEWGQSENPKVRQKAVQLLDRAEKIFPDAWILYSRRGFFLEKLGDSKRAQADLDRTRAMNPTSPLDRFWYGMLLHNEGDALKSKDPVKAKDKYRQALQQYAALLLLSPDHFWAYFDGAVCQFALGNIDEAIVNLTVCTQLRPEALWSYLTRGKILRKRQNPEEVVAAVTDFTRVLDNDADNTDVWLERAETNLSLKRWQDARVDFDRVRQLDAKRAGIYFGHGLASLRLQDFAAAHRDWHELAKLNPNAPEPHHFDGITFKAEFKYKEALLAEDRAIKIRTNEPSLLLQAQIYHQQGELNKALQTHEFILNKLKVQKAEVFNDHGDLLRTMKRWPEALAAYQKSSKVLVKQTDAYVGMALVHVLEGKAEQAEPIMAQMMAANAGSFMAHLRCAEVHRALGQWDDGLKDCDRAAALGPKSPLPALVRASIKAAQGNHEEAVGQAKAALKEATPDGQLFVAACAVYSLAADAAKKSGADDLTRQYADHAVQYLIDAMQRGFLDMNYQAYNRMLVDPTFAAVRRQPRVLEILPVLRHSSK